jgi:hypothetical protein
MEQRMTVSAGQRHLHARPEVTASGTTVGTSAAPSRPVPVRGLTVGDPPGRLQRRTVPTAGGVIRRTRADFKRGYDKRYREGYLKSFWTGLEELVQDGAITQQTADDLYEAAEDIDIAYAANWDESYSGTEGRHADYDDGKDVGYGAGFDQGYGDALKKGYARDYSSIPGPLKSQVMLENGGLCAYCGAQPSADVDHIRSLKWHWQVRGAIRDKITRSAEVNHVSNLVGACAACNRSKGAKRLLTQWVPPGWNNGTVWPVGPARLGAALPPDWAP